MLEKILNKKKFRGKDWYLVQQRGYIAKEDTWEPRENLGNMQELIEEFEEQYGEGVRQTKKMNMRENQETQLPGRYIAKVLYRWDNKKFDREYWEQLERNWRRQKRAQKRGQRILEMIKEEGEQEENIEKSRIEDWNKEDEIDGQPIGPI